MDNKKMGIKGWDEDEWDGAGKKKGWGKRG